MNEALFGWAMQNHGEARITDLRFVLLLLQYHSDDEVELDDETWRLTCSEIGCSGNSLTRALKRLDAGGVIEWVDRRVRIATGYRNA